MVVSRSDSKRRKKEEAEPLQESPKRTKVHAQRKFAQGSHLNSPVLTPVKDKDKNKYNGAAPSAELLPIKRPKTESFVNFLCFRGSDMLPKSLEFFNEPSIPEPLGGEDDKRDGASTSGHSRSGHRSSGDHLGSVAKAEAKNRSKSKSTAVQALKKKYQEQRMNKEKKTLTKLALKVKGKNMIRTRSAGPLDEKPSAPALQKKPLRTTQLVKTKAAAASRSSSTSASRKPVLKKQTVIVKRTASKSVTRGGLRSSGGLPPGSDKGLKTERKPRKVIKMKPTTAKKNAKKPAIASSLSDFSSDDDQPLVKKPRVMSKASILAGRVTTRSRLMRPSSQATSSRLPRKTKEAATLFMEMLKKDLGSPDEDEDIADAMSVDSYEDIPKQSERRGSKDSTDTTRSEKKSTTKSVKKETKPNENKPLVRNIRKLPEKPAARLTTLKTRTLRRNSYRLVSKELELKRLKTTRATLITRMSSRSSSKEISQDSSTEVEKSSPKTPTSDRESRRERRSHPSRVSDSKNKQHKAVTKERDSSSSKKKDAPETIFDDSDEEPLGKKVNQTKSPGTLKSPKKTRQSIEKEGNSNDITVDVDQKLTRRRSLNTSKDISKEDKQSAQTSAKAQQAVKKKENEVKGKGKTESTSKTKSATSIPKPKQVIEGTNETSENESQNTKETEKTSAENKSQSERNHKKSTAKESESETGVKSSENSKNMPSQIDKTTKKSANVQESEIGSMETCSKDVTKVLTPANKSSSLPQNAPKEEDALPLKTGKINPDKCNNSNTNATKKKFSTKRGAESGSKNNLSSVSDSAEEVIDCDTKSSECLSSPEPNKEKVHSDQTTRTCSPLDTKESKIQTELAVVFKTLQAESEKKVVEKVTPNQSINIGDAKKKQSSSKKIYLNESILSDNTQKTKVEASKKDDVKMELNESKNTLTSSLNDMSMGILCPSDTSKDGSISQEIKPSNVLNDTKETIANVSLNTAASQNLVWTKNVLQNQVLSSPIKGENNEVLKEENIKMPQVTEEKYFAKIANKSNKLNLHTKANEEDCKQSVKSEKIQNKTVREVTLAKNVQLLDGGKIDQKNPQITVDMKLNEKASCSKSSSQNEHDGKPDLKMAYPRGSTLVTNRTKCVLENKESRIVDVVVSKGADTPQTSQLTKQKETVQPTPLNTTACSGDGLKIRNVVLEPLLSRNLLPEVKCLPASPTLVPSDFNEKSIEQSGIKGIMANTKMLKPDANKSTIKQEMLPENSSKLGTLDMADKISSAVETLMSLKNVHKIDDKSFTIQTGAWNKSGQAFDVEHKRSLDLDTKRSCEGDQKPSDCSDVKKIKTKDSEVKRVTIQEPEFKRVTIQEPEFKRVTIQEPEFKRVTIQEPEFKRFNVLESDNKRPNTHESDFRRYQAQVQEHKPKPEHPQVLKGCSNPKSMLKPGTLIDIAGISHSPEIMTPLRPGVDGEIIPMHKPVRPYGQEGVDPFKGGVQGFKPFGLRWQGTSPEKNSKELLVEKESADSKSKTPVNESAWRLAFKNVKDPKSSNNVPTEKPVAKKQLSVTALAKKHKSKTEVVSDKTTMGQTSTSIPFLRQNKPFLGPSPTKAKEAGSVSFDVKKSSSTNVDPASLREKEAEVKEFLSQCGEYSRSLAPAASHVNPSTTTKADEDFNRSSSIKSPYLPSSNTEFTQSEQITGTQHQLKISSDARQTSHKDQPEPSSIFGSDSLKRAGSPRKFEKQIKTGLNSAELSPMNKTSAASTNSQQDQLSNKQTSSPSYMKPDQNVSIFQIDPLRRSSSPKSILQKSTIPGEQPLSIVGSQYNSPVPSSSKQLMPDKVRHFSPNRSGQSTVPDNFFSDSNLNKRTKSPTLMDSFSQQSNSPKGNSISRNTNSPVFGKCSTNIFKEIVPAKRSYSPTFLSSSQSDGESVPNVFSQTQNFRRSVSPLSNRSGFSKLVTTNEGSTETKKVKVDDKKLESSEDGLTNRNTQASVSSSLKFPTEQEPNNSTVNLMSQSTQPLQLTKPVDGDNALVKEEVNESEEEKNSNIVTCEDSNSLKLDVKPFSPSVNEKQLASPQDNEGTNTPAMSEAKHRLPLPVEQTLKKLGNTRSSQNKKTSLQKVKSSEENVKETQYPGIVSVQNEYHEENVKCTPNVFTHKMTTGIYSHNQEEELDLMQKKKVNMSAEEIKRWLNDSSTSEVVHRANCGILENDTCECEYRSTLTPSLQHIDSPKFETDAKNEVTSLSKPTPGSYDAIDKTKKVLNAELNVTNANVMDLRPSFGVKEKDDNTVKDTKNDVPYTSDPSCVTKQEPQKTATTPKKNTTPNQLKGEGLVSIKNFCVPVSVGSSVSTSTKQPTTPPVNKLRTFRLPNKNKDAEKPSTDTLDVSPPVRDDCSSSNELSSSNEETPEKSHERKSIFHQRRSALKVKERRELIAPSVNAFSPENESSVYAFDPELPPTSTPFRRSKGKDGKSTTTTDDEDMTPSSNSIAVQVNFDNEAVLECSTQTDVQEGDDDDTHTFYIPLQQSAADTSKPPLIQGVAVKVDTEGPDQKVIMRAKLVTKPLSTFNQSSPSPRGLIGTRSGKPEQKVRPLSVKPPVGTVQPTARPKPKPVQTQEEQPGPSKAATTCSPQAARLAKRIKSKAAVPSTSAENHPPKVAPAKLVEAPTFYPTEKEFEDPLEYISSITPKAEKYGLCRVVPPSNFKPECKVSDDMRFTAYNQYIHKMLHRWGPNVKEMLAIKKYLATQSIALTHPPWIGGMEVDLPRLYQTVQQCGGLKEVIEKKRWHRVADLMKIPKSAQDRVTKLDDIYCKFLLPYDTLSHVERTQLFEGVERDWAEREKRVANQQESENDEDEDSDSDSDSDIDECIVKGRSMALNGFYRIARNTMSMWFPKTDTPSAADVELEFWKHVASRQHHVCVHSGSIDSGAMGYGFPTGKNSSTSRHPWNLKMLTNNPGSILRFLGPIMGVTVPTLHVGMLFSACCWYRDPHGLPWIEYLHTGASKIWYGIPDSSSSQFRDAVMDIVPRLCRDKSLWLASDTAMVPPPLLVEKGVSLSRIVQDPGQFIVVFPKAFTSSICTGYLVSESVYYAQPSWLSTAQTLFNDLRESSEPTVFSLEKLLFTIVNDSRASMEVLHQILNIVVSLRDGEIAGRRQLEECGLNSSERLNSKRKGKARPAGDGEEDLECEECRMTLYISWMTNSQDGAVYCLPHAVELLSNKRSLVKHCTLVYAFSEEELEELVEKLKSRVENKNQKKSVAKGSKS